MAISPASSPSAPRVLARSPEDLLEQVSWFNRLRLGAVVGMVVLTVVGSHLLGVLADPRPLYALAAMTLLVDLAYIVWARRRRARSATTLRRHVDLQIAIDLTILTAILHYSGGVTNPFVLFYLFHAFIAALLLSVRAASVVAASSVALVTTLAFFERSGVLPHHPLAVAALGLHETSLVGLVGFLLVFAVTLLLSVYFVGTVLTRLLKREHQLVQVDRQLAQSEKLVSVGNLAAGVAHEINNPVGVIRSKVQILRHRIADGDAPGTLLEELETVDRHARRIATITAGLLTFSRETPFELVPLDLNRLVREGLELVTVPFRAAGVRLQTELAEPAPTVGGSANHLLQVLVNVLLNAKDASAPDAVVTVRTRATGTEAAIEIEDRGSGIAPEHLDKIFDPFFTTKDVDRGTGLGLAISHGIVEKHHGRIAVDSEPGRGSRFTVWLPKRNDFDRTQDW